MGGARAILRRARGASSVEMRLPSGDEGEFRRFAHEVVKLATKTWRHDIAYRLVPGRNVLLCRKRKGSPGLTGRRPSGCFGTAEM